MLGGLCLELSRCGKIRDKRYMNEAALMHCKLSLELADGFKEGLGLDIADGAADFNYHDLGAERSDGPLDAELYLIGDMGDDLNGSALIASAALAVEDCGIDLTGGGIIELCEIFIYKSLVVTDIEVCLGAVIGDENLAVLIRIHRTRVNIEIRIQLHN